MIAPILRVILAGMLGGVLLFIIPFLLFKALLFFLLLGLTVRLIAGGRRYRRWRKYQPFYDDYEVYESFQGKDGLYDHSNQNPKKI
jgi:hypothetical protein